MKEIQIKQVPRQSCELFSAHSAVSGCRLDADYMEGLYDADKKTWSIDYEVLLTHDNSLQPVLDCTNDGDILLFTTDDSFDIEEKMTITKSVTLSATADLSTFDPQDTSSMPESEEQAIFECPSKKEGAISVA